MRAIIYQRKGNASIYMLDEGGSKGDPPSGEVYEFLTIEGRKKTICQINGFIQLLNQVLEGRWHSFSEDHLKSWPVKGEIFSELIKGNYRIGCFMHEMAGQQRLLLVSWFRKHGDKETKEYNRATAAYRRFLQSEPIIWDEGDN